MMDRTDKENVVAKIKADIDRAQAMFLTNLIGMSSNDSAKVRRSVREAKGKVVITRNTLFKRAAVGTYSEKFFENLKGPTAIAFAFDDAVAVAKALEEASKELEALTLRGGILGKDTLSAAQVLELAALPSKPQMLATLLATFNAPVSAFVRLLNAIKEKKEKESSVTNTLTASALDPACISSTEVKEEVKAQTETAKADEKTSEDAKE